jgi:hypothetical protein
MTPFKMFLTTTLLTTTVLGACGSDDEGGRGGPHLDPGGTATFASATEAQRTQAVEAANLSDFVLMEVVALDHILVPDLDPGACPRVEIVGTVTTVTGGCTAIDADLGTETRIEGAFTVDDPGDYSRPLILTFSGFSSSGPDGQISIDGSGSYQEDGALTIESLDATVDRGAGKVHTKIVLTCDGDRLCTPDNRATIDIEGLGTASVEGAWAVSISERDRSGEMLIQGVDRLELDFDGTTDSDGCVPMTVDGAAAGSACLRD